MGRRLEKNNLFCRQCFVLIYGTIRPIYKSDKKGVTQTTQIRWYSTVFCAISPVSKHKNTCSKSNHFFQTARLKKVI